MCIILRHERDLDTGYATALILHWTRTQTALLSNISDNINGDFDQFVPMDHKLIQSLKMVILN